MRLEMPWPGSIARIDKDLAGSKAAVAYHGGLQARLRTPGDSQGTASAPVSPGPVFPHYPSRKSAVTSPDRPESPAQPAIDPDTAPDTAPDTVPDSAPGSAPDVAPSPEPSPEPQAPVDTPVAADAPKVADAPDVGETVAAALDPAAARLREQASLLRERCEAALALLDGSAARISSAAGGLRFSTLQKSHAPLVAELRDLGGREPDDAVSAALEGLLRKTERLISALASPERQPLPDGAGSAPPSPGATRQALIRGMITLAPAPLHLQIEFAPEFPLIEADPIVLAARSHAINRAVLGSLRRIQWDGPARYTLWFGDGEQRRVATGGFDAQGKIDLPTEYRQKQSATPRPAPGASEQRSGKPPPRQGQGQGETDGQPAGDPGSPRPPGSRRRRNRNRSGAAAHPGATADSGNLTQPQGGSVDGQAAAVPGGVPGGRGRGPQGGPNQQVSPSQAPAGGRRPGGPGQNRPSSPGQNRDGGERSRGHPQGRGKRSAGGEGAPVPPGGGRRDERQPKPSGRSAFPTNSMLADKLRAALSPRKEEPPKPSTAEPAAAPATRSDSNADSVAGEKAGGKEQV